MRGGYRVRHGINFPTFLHFSFNVHPFSVIHYLTSSKRKRFSYQVILNLHGFFGRVCKVCERSATRRGFL
ncbi:UNVERIFIED_CONTAM: hypothetical protein Sradi_5853900 [Sesamum radiatum]|uniref:Uncharacterized protein n=1 Tax=Sesamum radiatum TaxID=300843 RepID=A0AAW2KTR2_SESRA